MRFADMYKFGDRDESVAFKALVVHFQTISGSGDSAIRNYIVINQEKRPMIMRLWGDWLDNSEVHVSSKLSEPTIIVGLNMKVTTHNVISLTTRTTGYLMVNPPIPGNDELMGWFVPEHFTVPNIIIINKGCMVGINFLCIFPVFHVQ